MKWIFNLKPVLSNGCRLFGKRLALSNTEIYSKASVQPADASQEDVLVFADEVCDCGELDTDNCQICAAFAIKMGVFVNICKLTISSLTKIICHIIIFCCNLLLY